MRYFKDGKFEVSYKAFAVACTFMAEYLRAEQKRYNDIVLNNQDVDVERLKRMDDEIAEVLKYVSDPDFEYSIEIGELDFINSELKGFRTRIKYLLEYQEALEKKRAKERK